MSNTLTLQNRIALASLEVAEPVPVPTATEIALQLQNVSWDTGRQLLQEWADAIRQQVLHEVYEQRG